MIRTDCSVCCPQAADNGRRNSTRDPSPVLGSNCYRNRQDTGILLGLSRQPGEKMPGLRSPLPSQLACCTRGLSMLFTWREMRILAAAPMWTPSIAAVCPDTHAAPIRTCCLCRGSLCPASRAECRAPPEQAGCGQGRLRESEVVVSWDSFLTAAAAVALCHPPPLRRHSRLRGCPASSVFALLGQLGWAVFRLNSPKGAAPDAWLEGEIWKCALHAACWLNVAASLLVTLWLV